VKLVLLPGMDGTGELFEAFLNHYTSDVQVVSLPNEGKQNYARLADEIMKVLPKEEFILLAESFSGGLVEPLINKAGDRIKGVIMVVSFLTPPNKLILTLSKLLPVKLFAAIPMATMAHRLLFLGDDASPQLIEQFTKVIQGLPKKLLQQRIEAISSLKLPKQKIDMPLVYIQAEQDKLISSEKFREIEKCFSGASLCRINGPHFLMQTKPEEVAGVVEEAVQKFIALK